MLHQNVIGEKEQINKLKLFCSGRVPVLFHPSPCRILKLTYPCDISGLSCDITFKIEMHQGSLGEPNDILTQLCSNQFPKPNLTDNSFMSCNFKYPRPEIGITQCEAHSRSSVSWGGCMLFAGDCFQLATMKVCSLISMA